MANYTIQRFIFKKIITVHRLSRIAHRVSLIAIGRYAIVNHERESTSIITHLQSQVSKHLSNIFKSGELNQDSVHSILEYTASDGKMYKTLFYNLDAIISVGYRVNSVNATAFRRWATSVLRDYLLKGYSINQQLLAISSRKKSPV